MDDRIRGRLTYANVVATIALFIALGGGAWALSKDSIGSRELKKNAVQSENIDNGTVKGKDVKDETLNGADVADGSLGAAEIADSGVGAAEIADGAVGAPEVADASLTGGDIAPDSLTGAQLDEASLGAVADSNRVGGRAFAFGSGNPAAVTPDLIATLPALDAELQTDGDVDTDFAIALENTRAAGNISMVCDTGSGVAGPTGVIPGSSTDGTLHCLAWNSADPAGPGRSIIFCVNEVLTGVIRCETLRA